VDRAGIEIEGFDESSAARGYWVRDGYAALAEMKDELELALDLAPIPIVAEGYPQDALLSERGIGINEILAAFMAVEKTQASLVYRIQGGQVGQAMGRNLA